MLNRRCRRQLSVGDVALLSWKQWIGVSFVVSLTTASPASPSGRWPTNPRSGGKLVRGLKAMHMQPPGAQWCASISVYHPFKSTYAGSAAATLPATEARRASSQAVWPVFFSITHCSLAALFRGHRQDDGLDPVELALVHLHVLQLLAAEAGDHAQQAGPGSRSPSDQPP